MDSNPILGLWAGGEVRPESYQEIIASAIQNVTQPVYLIMKNGSIRLARHGRIWLDPVAPECSAVEKQACLPLVAIVPPLHPGALGDAYFKSLLRIRYAYVVGAMANGITSVEMVEAAGRAGMLGFYGAAGLSISRIKQAIEHLKLRMGRLPFGVNLIHSPSDPALEFETVRLYLEHGIDLISASAYMDLTLPLVYYRIKGIHRDGDGNVVCPNRIIGKISREEVARKFFSPPPVKIVSLLLDKGLITQEEADLAGEVPVAQILTAEADSGGHTDNRPALTLLPTIIALRNQMAEKHHFKIPLCVGLGGGIATPDAAAAAFSMGAAYVLTGSINQACVESGTSDIVRKMLAESGHADVTMAPAADMFEMGVKVQVLKRGTMFPLRAGKLYDLYSRYETYESIPEKERIILERDYFRRSFEDEWSQTRAFFKNRDPGQIKRSESDPKHKMALVFRSYLGQSSNWANMGEPSRRMDYQIWCGPAIGAFNAWVKGTFLENPKNRNIEVVAMNLLLGAATIIRAIVLKNQGIILPIEASQYAPRQMEAIKDLFSSDD